MNEEETTTEELRELVREAHGIIKDLNREKRETRTLIAELRAQVEEVRNAPKEEVETAIRRITDEAMKTIVDEVVVTTKEATEFVTETVYKRFDTLMDILLGLDQGRRTESIPDMLKRHTTTPKVVLDSVAGLADPIERPKP